MQTEEEDEDEEGLPDQMGEDAVEELMQPTQNPHWQMRKMAPNLYLFYFSRT